MPTDDPLVETGDDYPARLGRAFHEWAAVIESDDRPTASFLAKKYGVDEDELDVLMAMGYVQWRDYLSQWFAGGETERTMACTVQAPNGGPLITLTGTDDRSVFIVDEAMLRILDWKTGRVQRNAFDQLMGYLFRRMMNDDRIQLGYAAQADVRFGEIVPTGVVTRAQVEQWWQDYVADLLQSAKTFRPGDNCVHCPRHATCEGRKAHAATALETLPADIEITAENKAELGPMLVEAYRALRHVRDEAKKRLDAMRLLVQDIGPIPDARPLLERCFHAEEVDEATTLSLPKLEEIVKRNSDPGRGAAAIRLLNEELEAAGALTIETSTSLRVVKETAKGETA